MKPSAYIISVTLVVPLILANAQGNFLYDQQSGDENTPTESLAGIQVNQPIGQSFTPTFSAIEFVRFKLYDVNPGNGAGATLYVNLRSNSMTGPILAATIPVFIPDTFSIVFTNFFFSTQVGIVSGLTYFLQPVVQSGDAWAIGGFIPGSDYPSGTAFVNGMPGNDDLWFREGIIPEPSSSLLLLLGGGALLCVIRRQPQER